MGWWKIKDVETGQVDFDHECPTNPKFSNAVPGHEEVDGIGNPKDLFNGDGPADLMGPILRKISQQYEEAWGRPAKKEELTAVFNFCCNGMFNMEEIITLCQRTGKGD